VSTPAEDVQDGNYALMQNDNYNELMGLGLRLSNEIGCAVRYPVYGKNMFMCDCGVTFPVYVVKAGNWDLVREMHSKGGV